MDVPLSILVFVQSIIPSHLALGLHPVKTHLVHVKVADFYVVIADEFQSGIAVALRIELNVVDFGGLVVS